MWGHNETVLVTMLDVTVLTNVERRLQNALQVRDSFLSIASHELKTPLTTIGLQIQRLIRAQHRGDLKLPPLSGRDPIALLDRAFGRLNRLVSDLLDVSRIQAGKLEIHLSETDLADVVRDVTVQMKEEFALAKCDLEMNLEEPLVGNWDRSRLEQVVANLATNAIKYAVGKPVQITLHRDGASAVLRVKDQGIGIATEDQPRIFQRFERAASEREYGGLGLGLWIVGQIVSNLGGHISVQSTLGEGATFEVRLPLVETQLMAASA
jgi:signal transduction histidine kinase